MKLLWPSRYDNADDLLKFFIGISRIQRTIHMIAEWYFLQTFSFLFKRASAVRFRFHFFPFFLFLPLMRCGSLIDNFTEISSICIKREWIYNESHYCSKDLFCDIKILPFARENQLNFNCLQKRATEKEGRRETEKENGNFRAILITCVNVSVRIVANISLRLH